MSWDKNKDAHYAMYKFIRNLHFNFANAGGQMTPFQQLGEWKNAFVIDAVGAGDQVKKDNARRVAHQFNVYVTDTWDAIYESGKDLDIAIEELASALCTTNSQVKDLGDVVDSIYKFSDERY
jgi:ornithine cyclodeaminase/alanine dehydrogenase-like protein (mu-crystallin family)